MRHKIRKRDFGNRKTVANLCHKLFSRQSLFYRKLNNQNSDFSEFSATYIDTIKPYNKQESMNFFRFNIEAMARQPQQQNRDGPKILFKGKSITNPCLLAQGKTEHEGIIISNEICIGAWHLAPMCPFSIAYCSLLSAHTSCTQSFS